MHDSLPLDRTHVLNVARQAAQKAAAIVTAARRDASFAVKNKKSDLDLVTTADVASEKVIVETVRAAFPDHTFLAEESSPNLAPEDLLKPLWIIDPIDGTTNFVHGHYQVGISIAFAYRGTVEVGLVHAPFLAEEFTAIRGGGATVNGTPIRASTETLLKKALIATGFPYVRSDIPTFVRQFEAAIRDCRDIRRLGSAALDVCMVAAGRLEGFYETVNPWDIAAANLIAREAGAMTGHIHPRPSDAVLPPDLDGRELIVAAPGIFDGLRALLLAATDN